MHFLLAACVPGLAGFQGRRSAIIPMRTIHAARGSGCMMAGKIVVTDGTDSFYESRGIFQMLHDHSDFSAITAYSSSIADAKKMLLSRQARYSGLLDMLTFSDGEPAEAFAGAETWISINSDDQALIAQLAAAKAAGVKRVLFHYSSDGPSDGTTAGSLSGDLAGMTYTVLRTGKLTKDGGGGGMTVGELATPTCGDVPKDDVFRIVTEALTLDSAYGKMLSLCASSDVTQLKQMRQAGCTRREEADALLSGKIKEAETVIEAEETEEQRAERMKSEEQKAEEQKATDEEELQNLIDKARKRAKEEAERQAKLEAEKAALRAEREAYYKTLEPQSSKEDGDKSDDEADKTDDPPPPPKPPSPPSGDDGKKGGDDDGLALA